MLSSFFTTEDTEEEFLGILCVPLCPLW